MDNDCDRTPIEILSPRPFLSDTNPAPKSRPRSPPLATSGSPQPAHDRASVGCAPRTSLSCRTNFPTVLNAKSDLVTELD